MSHGGTAGPFPKSSLHYRLFAHSLRGEDSCDSKGLKPDEGSDSLKVSLLVVSKRQSHGLDLTFLSPKPNLFLPLSTTPWSYFKILSFYFLFYYYYFFKSLFVLRGEGEAERGRQNPKQALHCQHRA